MSNSSDNKTQSSNLDVFWGPKHQIFYANAFQIRINDTEVQIELGTIQNMVGADRLLSSNQLIVSPKAAKMLAIILSKAVENIEDRLGEIKLDTAQVELMLQAISKAGKPSS